MFEIVFTTQGPSLIMLIILLPLFVFASPWDPGVPRLARTLKVCIARNVPRRAASMHEVVKGWKRRINRSFESHCSRANASKFGRNVNRGTEFRLRSEGETNAS